MRFIVLFFRSLAYVGGLMAFAEFGYEAFDKGHYAVLGYMAGLAGVMFLALWAEEILKD